MIPRDRKVTYMKCVVDLRPQKQEVERTRLVLGGDKVDYPFNVSTNTTDLDTTKIHFNSVISTPGARFMGLDLKDFYLGTIMKRYEYAKIKIDIIPMEIVTQYHLHEYVDQQGYVNFEIRKGMYGLPQAGRLANEQLQEYLEPFGYTPTKRTPGL